MVIAHKFMPIIAAYRDCWASLNVCKASRRRATGTPIHRSAGDETVALAPPSRSRKQPSRRSDHNGRRILAATGGLAALAAVGSAFAEASNPAVDTKQGNETMEIRRNGSQPSRKGPAENFTGAVRIDPLFEASDPSRVSGASVAFEPGARTVWHTHPLGQTLIVTAGLGWTQCWGGPVAEIRPGDVVRCPPGVKHWHGASPTTAMTHIAIQEALNGKVVDWMEKVSDEQYRR